MSNVLEVVGLLALVVAAVLVAVWLGFAVFGGSCLFVAWRRARAVREVAEVEQARRLRRAA